MTSSARDVRAARALRVAVRRDELTVELEDGRSLIVPIAWFPRLVHATAAERSRWRLVGGGVGIHWEALDEDLSVEGLLAGRPSGESQASLAKWLARRRRAGTRGS
jgi:hypothetical protein